MSTILTYCDPDDGVWRNRLVGREPFPKEFGDVEPAVSDGQQLALFFGADHVVAHPSGRLHQVPSIDPTGASRSA